MSFLGLAHMASLGKDDTHRALGWEGGMELPLRNLLSFYN